MGLGFADVTDVDVSRIFLLASSISRAVLSPELLLLEHLAAKGLSSGIIDGQRMS